MANFIPQVSAFSNLYGMVPVWNGPLLTVVQGIAQGKWSKQITELRKGKNIDRLKKALPAITPSGIFTAIKNEALETYSEIVCLDYDKVTDPILFRQSASLQPSAFAAFLSPTGTGLKVLVRVQGTEHAANYLQVQRHYDSKFGIKSDASCKNIARLCFVSFDPEAHINPDAKPFVAAQQLTLRPDYFHDSTEQLVRFTESHPSAGRYLDKDNRNNFLFRLACNCSRYGFSRSEAEVMCKEQWLANNSEFPESELQKTVHSAYRKTAHEHGTYSLPGKVA